MSAAALLDGELDDGPDDEAPADLRWIVHNLIAHPLLVLCPPLGELLHRWTA